MKDTTSPPEGSQEEKRKLEPWRTFDYFNPQTEPVFQVNDVTVATAGNLCTITAQSKAGKSAVVGAAISAALTNREDVDCLGWSSPIPFEKRFAVVHFDTEQSADDFWHCGDRIIRRAGIKPPDNFISTCLTGIAASESRQIIRNVLEDASARFGGMIHSIFIDGVADIIEDVNKADMANRLVSDLHAAAIKFNCPIICVLHFNPINSKFGVEKSRGHLGSQLERKSESNLRLTKNGDISCLWSEKQRGAPIPEDKGPCFAWSDEARMHVSVESKGRSKDDDARDKHRHLVDEIFHEHPAYIYSNLVAAIAKKAGIAQKTAEGRFTLLKKLTLIRETSVTKQWEKAY